MTNTVALQGISCTWLAWHGTLHTMHTGTAYHAPHHHTYTYTYTYTTTTLSVVVLHHLLDVLGVMRCTPSPLELLHLRCAGLRLVSSCGWTVPVDRGTTWSRVQDSGS